MHNAELGGRCINLRLRGTETPDDVMRLTGLEYGPAREIAALAAKLAKRPTRKQVCQCDICLGLGSPE